MLATLLTACDRADHAPPPAVSASNVMHDLGLSTQAPPPLPAPFARAVTPAMLSEPIILRRMQPTPTRGGKSGAAAETGTISLNFEKASLRSVIDAILGDALGVPYNVDERVDGIVTLVSPQKLGREAALEVLDGVLRMNGATLIRGENLYRVVLTANARQNLAAPQAGPPQPGYGVSVYVPSHTAAASLQKLIEPLYQISGALAADSEHNLLLVTGSAEERRALMESAHLFDQDWLANQSVGLFPLHQAHPRAMVEELKTLFATGGAAAAGTTEAPSSVRFSAIERLNAVMVVSLQASGIDRAAEWIARLDQTGAGERTLHVYPVHYANVQGLAKTLSRLFASGGGNGAETGNAALPSGVAGTRIATPASAAPVGAGTLPAPTGAGATQGGGGFGSSDHSLGKDSAGDGAADSGADDGSGAGPRVIADVATHTLLVVGNQSETQMIEQALARLDARPAQILIEATIVEVTLNKSLQYGVQYYLRGNKLLGNQTAGSIGFNSSTASGAGIAPLSGSVPGFNGVIGSLTNPSVILSALDSVTDTKVLSSPQLLVTDSREAMLKVGTQTPLLTQQATSTLTTGAPIVSSVEYHDTGVILRVLPRTNEADMVSMDIAQEVSEVVATDTTTLTPSIEQRRIESAVTVQSGQTVMLGGLISENNSAGRDGLPGLASVPVIGGLIGNTTDSRLRTELIVFITPHVLHDGEDAQRLTEELMGRLQSMRPPPQSP